MVGQGGDGGRERAAVGRGRRQASGDEEGEVFMYSL